MIHIEVAMWGERIDHLRKDDCYYAHLSLYRFASAYCKDAVVLDAGSGNGYGSAYLADHGAARVVGIDGDVATIASCTRNFQRSNLQYQVQDLRRIAGLGESAFDVIVASNSLEHVAGVESFFRSAVRLLKPDGVLISAVPTARTEKAAAEEMGNLHHVNIWSPRHWRRVHARYFAEVRCHSHLLTNQDGVLRAGIDPAETVIRETDFEFPEEEVEGLYRSDTHTAIFVCGNPLPEAVLPPAGQPEPITDHSISRRSYPAWIRPFLWTYYRTAYVARYEGFAEVLRRAFRKFSPPR